MRKLSNIDTSSDSGGKRGRSVLALTVLRSTVVLAFMALVVAFWLLQVAQHDRYLQLAENNHQRTVALTAPRGTVFV